MAKSSGNFKTTIRSLSSSCNIDIIDIYYFIQGILDNVHSHVSLEVLYIVFFDNPEHFLIASTTFWLCFFFVSPID